MDWKEVTVYTTTEGIEPVAAMLEDNGVESYVLEDAEDFRGFMKDTEIYWDYLDEELVREKSTQETCLKFYLTEDDEGAEKLAGIRAGLEKLAALDSGGKWGRLFIETATTRKEDWEWGWKQYFKPFPVGDGFMIKPSWETVEDTEGRRILEIDPASSFGTGSHATTQMCIMELENEVKPGVGMLDMGTGSGILAIAASMLGAEVKTVVDIDPNCLRTAAENAEKNGVDIGRGICGDVLRSHKLAEEIGGENEYGLITANIVADVISRMAPLFWRWLKKDGILICSGIIEEKVVEVRAALEQCGFTVCRQGCSQGWSVITLVK